MKTTMRVGVTVLGAMLSTSLTAQNWPLPADTPNTPTVCSASCPSTYAGKPTMFWSDPVVAFTGRFLDSAYEQDWQQTFRTARATVMRTNPAGNRIYFILGNAVAAYDAGSFFQRLQSHEALMSATAVPVNPPNVSTHPGQYENFLNFDQFFYAENTGSGWITPPGDGQDRLFDFDVDDRGIVYMAYSMFGWGMANDSGTPTHGLMSPSFQDTTSPNYSPRRIFWLKSPSGSYFAFVGEPAAPTLVFNVSDWHVPVLRGILPDGFVASARSDKEIGVVTESGEFRIYDNGSLIDGRSPLLRETIVPAGSIGTYATVVFDGTSFWVGGTSGAAYSGVVSKYSPDGSAWLRTDYQLSSASDTFEVLSMRYHKGYIGMGVHTSAGLDPRIFRVDSGTPVEVPLNAVFFRYYSSPLVGYVRAPRASVMMIHPWLLNGSLYAVIPASGLGDVWQLQASPVPSGCATLVLGTNVSASFHGQHPGCAYGGICSADEAITLGVNFGGAYDSACSTHTFTWKFDDDSQLTGREVTRALTAGTHTISCVVDNGTQSVTLPLTPTVKPANGDANGDGQINAADVFYLVNYLFAGGPPADGNADVNGDGVVNAADLFYLINYVFAGGPPPQYPA